ncbi:MAG: DUF3892 domain-containing protein [Flavobacterium sp.]|nr:MAG: DUF3892 domain-containing protein [Flavobacterium sp.]
MANYMISGVWKDGTGRITHYAFHDLANQNRTMGLASKITKARAIEIVSNSQNSVVTGIWNYTSEGWQIGTDVHVVGTVPNRYLRTTHDNTVRDNLSHLINYGFVANNFI